MKKVVCVLVVMVSATAFAANQPVVKHTFVCNGDPKVMSGPCPGGAATNSLILGSDGNLYGAALYTAENINQGGAVFSLSPSGTFKILHAFVPGINSKFFNGNAPYTIVEGPDGNLYGATLEGGNNGGDPHFQGYGVVFRVSKTGTGFKVIHRFCSETNCTDGADSIGSLVVGNGNVYGTTSEGGSSQGGTIFQITPSTGAYTVAHSFSASNIFPNGLTSASDGTFYGITANGNSLFHFDPVDGAVSSTSLSFPFPPGCKGLACTAFGGVSFGANGNLYGLYTIYNVGGVGLFEVHPDGSGLQLFTEYETNANADATNGLVRASDGNLWSAEYNLGTNGPGDLVAISPSSGTIVQKVTPYGLSAAVGANPIALFQAADGTFWGSTFQGGTVTKGHFGGGTVYNLNLGLPPR